MSHREQVFVCPRCGTTGLLLWRGRKSGNPRCENCGVRVRSLSPILTVQRGGVAYWQVYFCPSCGSENGYGWFGRRPADLRCSLCSVRVRVSSSVFCRLDKPKPPVGYQGAYRPDWEAWVRTGAGVLLAAIL